MTTLTAETLAELERIRGALDCPSDYDLGANDVARWAWNQAMLEHFPALIAAARERNDFSELLDDKIDKLRFAIEDADRNWKRAIAAETELTATRRALRLAQAKVMRNKAAAYLAYADNSHPDYAEQHLRMQKRCERWAEKFERMAADCTEETANE